MTGDVGVGDVMGLLAAGVPLSLLADLVSPPDSVEVLLVERHVGSAHP